MVSLRTPFSNTASALSVCKEPQRAGQPHRAAEGAVTSLLIEIILLLDLLFHLGLTLDGYASPVMVMSMSSGLTICFDNFIIKDLTMIL